MNKRNALFIAGGVLILAALFLLLRPVLMDTGPQELDVAVQITEEGMEPELIEVREGDQVTLHFTAPEEGSIHLHGYDLETTVLPGEVAELAFTASTTGKFALELHLEDESHEHEHEDEDEEEEPVHLGFLEVYPR